MSIFAEKRALELSTDLLKFFLPEFIVDHFDVVKTEQQGEVLHLFFEEKNVIPVEFSDRILVSKGFHSEVTIQDFPLRGKRVFLHVKRRRWTEKESNNIIQRNWSLVAKGSRMTEEFATFLKEISRF